MTRVVRDGKSVYMDDSPCPEGLETIRNIVLARADAGLFEESTLQVMIEKTGGSLRDLFAVIRDAATRARRRRADTRVGLKQFRAAADSFLTVLQEQEKRLGLSHPDGAELCYNIAMLSMMAGDRDRFRQYMRKAYEIRKKIFGNNDARTIKAKKALESMG